MKTNLQFDFSVDRENNTITIVRDFDAPHDKVWAAWTQKEWLDQWWAPKPYRMQTKTLDFKPGGYWLYAMISPEGNKHWCRADYKSVNHGTSFSYVDAFCDENGLVGEEFPGAFWTNTFTSKGETSTVHIFIKYKDLANLEKIIEMGFKEGLTMCLGNLDEVLS